MKLCELLSAKVHVAPRRSGCNTIKVVANGLNATCDFSVTVVAKRDHNRFNWLQCSFYILSGHCITLAPKKAGDVN